MSNSGGDASKPKAVLRLWRTLWRPSARRSLGALVSLGFAAGVLFWGAFNWSMDLSNSESFCISCHEMRSTVYVDLQKTVHWSNPSGVRASCADCHVPKAWSHKVVRKVQATFNELPKHIIGTMDTREEFDARRLAMAGSVWAAMKATDSRECRNCHQIGSMAFERQHRNAQRKHERSVEDGDTCIDCHQGIAHELPEGWQEVYDSLE